MQNEINQLLDFLTEGTKDFRKNLDFLMFVFEKFIATMKFTNKEYFENKFNGNKNEFDSQKILEKITTKKSGFDMELNYVLCVLLKQMGFETYLVKTLKPKPPDFVTFYDYFHLGIIVIIDQQKYYLDGAHGELFTQPIPLIHGHSQNNTTVKIDTDIFLFDSKLILKIIDFELSVTQIKENYRRFFDTNSGQHFLCKTLIEKIFDPETKQFITPNTRGRL